MNTPTTTATATAAAHEALFGDALSCHELRPAAFLPGALDAAAVQSLGARGEALLRALAVVEDGARNEEPEQPADHAVHRIEAKLDLLTALVASLATSHDADPSRELQWSSHGACLAVDEPLAIGATGRFRVQPADWLPSPLLLPATVLACDAGLDGQPRAWLRFGPLSPPLEAALERHLFRVHRRAVAESRRPR
ncbi:PilZ domain-containing protein [Lysobacter koreensis]|uniref:PilZ domain-containing protein n=1 Tax=Lysobacter koreensis TaxID=266122 RepID=A0ABW2YLD2_9GAMM